MKDGEELLVPSLGIDRCWRQIRETDFIVCDGMKSSFPREKISDVSRCFNHKHIFIFSNHPNLENKPFIC